MGEIRSYVEACDLMPNFSAEVKQGRIVPDMAGIVALSILNGKRITVSVEIYRRNRSRAQSNYYWGVCVAILSEHCGYTKDEMHAALCHKFLGSVDEKTGLMKIGSTSGMTTVAFEEYASKVRQWAGEELGVFVPLPNEPLEDKS